MSTEYNQKNAAGTEQRGQRRRVGHDKRGFYHMDLLSKRKIEQIKCELCDRMGCILCDQCKVTYYCSVDHFLVDKEFHACLCAKVKNLRQPIEFHPQSETRERWKKQRRLRMEEIYHHTWKKGQADMEGGNYDSAIPSATVSTQYAQVLYGHSEQMIPPLLIAAESNLRTGKLRTADGFVARALSIEVSKPDIRPFIKAKIRRNEGLIALARSNLQEALESFSEEIYQSTEEFGPNHIKTSGGYCYLGRVFHLNKQFHISSSLFRQTVEIWIAFLEPILKKMTAQTVIPIIGGVKTEDKVFMEDCDKFEGLRLLTRCYEHQMNCYEISKKDPVSDYDLACTCYAISMLYYICERYSEAENKVAEGQYRIEMGKLLKHPIHNKLSTLFKHSTRKSYQAEKMASSYQSSYTSMAEPTSTSMNQDQDTLKSATVTSPDGEGSLLSVTGSSLKEDNSL